MLSLPLYVWAPGLIRGTKDDDENEQEGLASPAEILCYFN